MKQYILYTLLILSFLSCDKEKLFDGPNAYSDDFSSYTEIDELIREERWSFFQKTYAENTITIDTTIYHSGNRSIRTYAVPTEDGKASKASINKQFMAFWSDETVAIEAWFYIVGNSPGNWLFLLDLEEKVNIGAGPGMRLVLVDNQLRVEHKYPQPDIKQIESVSQPFPRDEWVKVRFEVLLSQKEEGTVRVWQNDQLIIEQYDWQTLPKDILYANLGTKGMYSQIEFGATANASSDPMTVYVDDVSVNVLP